ncbi:hypothetical protein [Acrocarpospora sp. B8E8]|uniref:hypothetical protein n=1 Tax=Acrocarpospora sp. B8E8 TaxID=3153572 RepID=UPI00325E3D2E
MIRPIVVLAGAALFAAPVAQAASAPTSYTAQDQARYRIPLPIIDSLRAGLGLGGGGGGLLGGRGGPLGGSGGGLGAGGLGTAVVVAGGQGNETTGYPPAPAAQGVRPVQIY